MKHQHYQTQFSAVITPDSLSFIGPDGTSYSYQESMSEMTFQKACDYIRHIQMESDDKKEELIEQLIILISPTRIIPKQTHGRIVIEHGIVKFDGEPIHNAVTENILWGLNEGYNVTPYMAFLEKLDENPSHRAVNELFGFIEKHKLVINEDGDILAYKKVQENFFDIHSGTIDNSIGNIVKVKRNAVDDNFGLLCSQGLHCCSFDYLPHYSSAHNNRVLLIKIHPRDVVSIPEHGGAKMRVCEYEVLREIPYNHGESDVLTEDHLTDKPIWTHEDIHDYTGVDIGDLVKYVGLNVKYNLLNVGEIYTVSKVQQWGGTTYVSVDRYPENTIFLFKEFEKIEEEGTQYTEEEFDDVDSDWYHSGDNGDNPSNWDNDAFDDDDV